MTLSDTILRLVIGTRIVPTGDDVSGDLHLGRDSSLALTAADVAWRARITSNNGVATIDLEAGTITPNAAPVAQVETATITAAAGATASGNLALTLTSAHVTGSPLAVAVPLVAGVHTTAALIAAACRAVLAATAAVSSQYAVGGTGAAITLTRHLYLDGTNDATLNLAIAAGLGVSAAATSADTTAGVVGASVERLGGDGLDLTGAELPICGNIQALVIYASGGTEGMQFTDGSDSPALVPLYPGQFLAIGGPVPASEAWGIPSTLKTVGQCVIDLIVYGSTT